MSTLRRGTIKSYSTGTHAATVQIAGSLSVWLESIPVSSGIPAAEVDAGDECAVLFFTDDNPDDAVIIAVYPGVPSAAGGGDADEIHDADDDTGVRTEQSADEDNVRIRVAGTERLRIKNATVHAILTGDMTISGALGVGGHTLTPSTEYVHAGAPGTSIDGMAAMIADMGGTSAIGAGNVIGIAGRAVARDAATIIANGLDYLAGSNGQNLTTASAIAVTGFASGSGKTLTTWNGIKVLTPQTIFATLTNAHGIDMNTFNVGTNRIFIKTADMTGGTICRYIQLGTNPEFMVKGTGELTRAANQTPVFIAEGTTPTVRQVQWKDGAAIGAGDRVMVLV